VSPVERGQLQAAMVALAEGDRGAFDRVFSTLWPILRAVSGRMLAAPSEADDAAQQALCKLLAQAWRFEADKDALPWALTFVINECRTARNRSRRRPVAAVDPSVADPAASPEARCIERELLAALEAAIGELTFGDRQALGLEDTGDAAPAATVRKRRQRALSRLRVVWRKLHGAV
jgi:RNA polymerase sigma-70 factor (ECF subfamily)